MCMTGGSLTGRLAIVMCCPSYTHYLLSFQFLQTSLGYANNLPDVKSVVQLFTICYLLLFAYVYFVVYSCVNILVCRIFGQFSMEVILATAFGQKIQILQGEANDLTRAAKAVIDGFSQLRGSLLLAAILGELLPVLACLGCM